MDIEKLQTDLEKACSQAVATFQQHQSEETHSAAYAKLDGLFRGAMVVLRVAGYNVIDGNEGRIVRRVVEHFQAELLKDFPVEYRG